MKISILEEIDKNIIEICLEKYNIDSDVVESLIRTNNCIVTRNNSTNDIEGFVLGAISLDNEELCVSCKVIAIWGIDIHMAVALANHHNSLIPLVKYSSKCMQFMEVKYDNLFNWHKLIIKPKDDLTSRVLDKNTYSKDFKRLKFLVENINSNIQSLSDDRDEFYTSTIENRILNLPITEHHEGIYSFQLLSKEYCEIILSKTNKYNYSVNCDENTYAQIPEVVLEEHDDELYSKMYCVFLDSVKPLSKLMYGVEPKTVNSIQLARYSSGSTDKGNWHFDEDSDITLVISLNNEHSGGGTVIKPYGLGKEFIVPQLQAGEALLFRGKHYMHKGLPVTSGTRDLMVFWSESN